MGSINTEEAQRTIRTLQLLVKRSGGKFSPHLIHFLIMKFFAIIAFVGYTQAFLVRREAAPEADADADAGYGYGAVSPAAVSAPVCNSVPEKVCKDRTIETPRKVCHTEHDEIVDTTITEHCEEVITTKCEQTSTQSRHSSAIVGQDSKVVLILPSGDKTCEGIKSRTFSPNA